MGEQDIIPVPAQKNGVPGVAVIQVHFTDFTGKVMFHCHVAADEDGGMMSFINVVDPSPGYPQRFISPQQLPGAFGIRPSRPGRSKSSSNPIDH
jgi:hypothetical protein